MNNRRRAIMAIQSRKTAALANIPQWNQLHPMGNRSWGYGLTGSFDATAHTITVTGTSTATVTQPLYPPSATLNYTANHRYLVFPSGFSKGAVLMYNSSGNTTTSPIIVSGSRISTDYPRFRCGSGIDFGEGITVQVQVFDLTVIFGAGNEPTTVAEFLATFSKPYYTYKTASGNTDGATKYEYRIVDAQNEIYEYKEIVE